MDFNYELKLIFNYKVQPTCQLFKKNQLSYLNILTLCLRMVFHSFSFNSKSNKSLFSWPGSLWQFQIKNVNLGLSHKNLDLTT